MRKRTLKLGIAFLLCLGTACSRPAGRTEGTAAEGQAEKEPEVLDLTFMSATAIYSEVLNMMTSPEQYRFRKVKISGYFGYREDENTGKMIFGCVIPDATKCCEQGIEIIRSGEYSFPEDYPEPGEIITVEGTFDYYTDGTAVNLQLKDAELYLSEEG